MNRHFDDARLCLEAALAAAQSLEEKSRLLRFVFTLQAAQGQLALSLQGTAPVQAFVAERVEGDVYVRLVGELDSREGRHVLKRQGLAINPGRRSAGSVELYPLKGAGADAVMDAEVLRVYLECAYWKACACHDDAEAAVCKLLVRWTGAAVARARRLP
jgi:hypothetical protein